MALVDEKPHRTYDAYLHWEILRECTFCCEYCFASPQKGRPQPVDISRISERLKRFNKRFLITFTGGEPFLIPNFVQLVKELTKDHYVRVDTNFSLAERINEFIDVVDPAKVFELTFSVHINEREKRKMTRESLAALVKKVQSRGFNVVGNYVLFPPLMARFKDDINFFKSRGIEVLPSLFVGRFAGKDYPSAGGELSYSKSDSADITQFNAGAFSVLERSHGKFCHAGPSAFFVNPDYEVFPCVMVGKKLGNFWDEWTTFPKVIRCPEEHCYCPFNKAFSSSRSTASQELLLEKTMADLGTASRFGSFCMTANTRLILKRALNPFLDRLGLRDFYCHLRKQLKTMFTPHIEV